MLKLAHVDFILQSFAAPGLVVPVSEAKLAAETIDALQALKAELEKKSPPNAKPANKG